MYADCRTFFNKFHDAFRYMDFICIMSYDLHGSWESFTGLHTGLDASDADSDKTLNVVSALMILFTKR